MVDQVVLKRILIDGAVLTTRVSPVLMLGLYINPHIFLTDYPEHVQAAAPVRTRAEVRQGILLSSPALSCYRRCAPLLDLASKAGGWRHHHLPDCPGYHL